MLSGILPLKVTGLNRLLDAASDSYAGFHLYHVLETRRRAMTPVPPRPAHAELNLPIRLANGQTVATWNESSVPIEEPREEPMSGLDINVEELVRDFTNIEIEDSILEDAERESSITDADAPLSKAPPPETRSSASSSSSSSSSPASAPPPASKASSNSSGKPSPQACVVRANEWATNYANNLLKGRKPIAKPADLRAYYLWHHERHGAREITSVYGKQLELSTVVGYIFNAIRLEQLPFDKDAAWALVPHGHRFFKKGYMATILKRFPPQKKDADLEDTRKDVESEEAIEKAAGESCGPKKEGDDGHRGMGPASGP